MPISLIDNNLAWGLLLFCVGLVVGYFIRYFQEVMRKKLETNHHKRKSDKPVFQINTSNFVIFILGLGLLISIIAEVLIPTYKTNPLLYAAMGTVIGFLFKDKKE